MQERLKRIVEAMLRRLSFLFFVVSAIIFFYYVIGCYQSFLEESQATLLAAFGVTSFLSFITSAYGLLYAVIHSFTDGDQAKDHVVHAVMYTGSLVVSAALLAFSLVIRVVVTGVH